MTHRAQALEGVDEVEDQSSQTVRSPAQAVCSVDHRRAATPESVADRQKCHAPLLRAVLSAAVLSRRNANVALECSGKRRRRVVACSGRNHEQFVVGYAQAFCGGIEPHASQVSKRWFADQASELAREG